MDATRKEFLDIKNQAKKIKLALNFAKSDTDFKVIEEALVNLDKRVKILERSQGLFVQFNQDGSIKSLYRTYESENSLNKGLKRLVR